MPTSAHPLVKVGGTNIQADANGKLIRTVVDTHALLPDMFELTFDDHEGNVVPNAHIEIGSRIEVYMGPHDSGSASKLIDGEVTSIEANLDGFRVETIVRGYEKAYRLQRGRRTKTYPNASDSDIAREVADRAGLDIGTIDDSDVVHDLVSQVAQSDWDFLRGRAREIGWETGVLNGEFFFRKPKPADPSLAGGGGIGGALSAVASMAGVGGGLELNFMDELLSFRPRVTAAGQVPSVKVRAWDPVNREAIEGASDAVSVSAKLSKTPADLANASPAPSVPGLPSMSSVPSIPGAPSLGDPDDGTSYIAIGRPLATSAEADAVAKSVAEHVASTFAEAEGVAHGNPAIQAGEVVEIKRVPAPFGGKWVVTQARHMIEAGTYRTAFVVSGRQERSLLGLASIGASNNDAGAMPRIAGLVPAVVHDNNDDQNLGRVKVMFPWLAGDYISDWARVAQAGAGQKGGAVYIPEPNDEVLVGFEFGDPRRPYVIAGLYNPKDSDRPDMSGLVNMGKVKKRFFQSRLGHQLVFHEDDMAESGIELTSQDQKLKILMDVTNKALKITAEQDGGSKLELTASGDITIEAKAPGKLTIKGGADVSIEATQKLELKGPGGVTIDGAAGGVKVSGSKIELN